MRASRCIGFLAAVILQFETAAMELVTGKMLGSGNAARPFYVPERSRTWRETDIGKVLRSEAAGRPMTRKILN